MTLFGLTGGLGMGKSTAAEILRKRGVSVVDTDIIAREVVQPGGPALAEIKDAFGGGVVDDSGRLRRGELARLVFADAEARRKLEAILHPRIRTIWLAHVAAWRAANRSVGAVIIPLLFETDAADHFDATICVACSAASQHQRLQARGWTDEQIQQRINAQWPIEKKMLLSDYVIWTEGGLDVHEEQLKRIIQR